MMYTRGQFAAIGKVGRKALRIYHDEGLLVPAKIGGENGYHYYEENQLAILEKIKGLRKIGLSLYEIRQVLDGRADEKELVGGRIREMALHLKEAEEFLSSTGGRAEKETGGPDIRPFGRCRCIFIEENVELENLGISVGRLHEKAAREGLSPAGGHFVIYGGLSDGENFSMKTCLPICGGNDGDAIEVHEEKCVHINFRGGFSKVAAAHILIKEYAESRGLNLDGKAYESYNKNLSVDVYYPIAD